jgi:hypothetical protein
VRTIVACTPDQSLSCLRHTCSCLAFRAAIRLTRAGRVAPHNVPPTVLQGSSQLPARSRSSACRLLPDMSVTLLASYAAQILPGFALRMRYMSAHGDCRHWPGPRARPPSRRTLTHAFCNRMRCDPGGDLLRSGTLIPPVSCLTAARDATCPLRTAIRGAARVIAPSHLPSRHAYQSV